MQKAIESKTKFGKDGKLLEREWSVGTPLIWALAVIILGLAGKTLVLPSILPQLLGK